MAALVVNMGVEFAFNAAEDPLDSGVVVVVLLLCRLDERDNDRNGARNDGYHDGRFHGLGVWFGRSRIAEHLMDEQDVRRFGGRRGAEYAVL